MIPKRNNIRKIRQLLRMSPEEREARRIIANDRAKVVSESRKKKLVKEMFFPKMTLRNLSVKEIEEEYERMTFSDMDIFAK